MLFERNLKMIGKRKKGRNKELSPFPGLLMLKNKRRISLTDCSSSGDW